MEQGAPHPISVVESKPGNWIKAVIPNNAFRGNFMLYTIKIKRDRNGRVNFLDHK
ncbi:MAG: hypothetical protein UV74_C0013G0195 [Candidatus Woesebacteria bacterium GW2011_GWB1_43_14]|uniref:Uncharacterized protein n=1 Tax=Candidatus Woesebacteria bacterium GW2011_GWB1_43_14 TaxID=1618578 RepID=A0A0G1GDX7_9BACT|nr:MAG: hypothetical protein UV51_C0005G0026 [Candidatus Woesebacteria bacterium GW2011_GWC1_42_9]KKS97073.1 MAG: hypothetical protein UV74_C0013G0195 [Candidatus Woesebacteria bacterium GW2011_GWB1_43_14]